LAAGLSWVWYFILFYCCLSGFLNCWRCIWASESYYYFPCEGRWISSRVESFRNAPAPYFNPIIILSFKKFLLLQTSQNTFTTDQKFIAFFAYNLSNEDEILSW